MLDIYEHNDACVVTIFLFDEPQAEMEDFTPSKQGILDYLVYLGDKLGAVAKAAEKLEKDGWTLDVVHHQLEATHPDVHTEAEAVERIRRLGVDDDVSNVW